MRRLFIVLALLATAAIQPLRAEADLEQPIRIAIKAHFEEHLASDTCSQYFRFYSMDFANWTWVGGTAKAQVVFYAQYISPKTLYGTAARTKQCLGREVGEGFFQTGQTYRSSGYIYTMTKWSQGWHVDKVEIQP